MRMYKVVFRAMPNPYKKWITDNLRYANFSILPDQFSGFSLLYGSLFGLSIGLLAFLIGASYNIILLAITGVFLLFEVFVHSMVILVADNRAKFTEDVLPDALRLMASNIKSGLTSDKSLLLAARPEFGPLEIEIRRAAKKALSGEPLEDAITSLSDNINSNTLNRATKLISEGMARGGNIAPLLESLAEDIRQTKIIKSEIKAYVMMYVIFIFFAAAIGAPLLYAISSFLVKTMTALGSEINVENIQASNIKTITFSKGFSDTFLMLYSLVSMGVTSFFGGIMIGLVQQGSEKAGIKYVPILFAVSVSIYFISKILVSSVFGGLIIS